VLSRRNGRGQEWLSRASTNTKVGHRMRGLAGGVIESSSFETIDHQSITSNTVHSSQLHLDYARFSIIYRRLCKEAPFSPHFIHLHNRQHGFGGNYDCVRLACQPFYHFLVLILPPVSTTARAAETATTYLRDGMPKQMPPTSSSNTRHKPTLNPLSAS
jgi:hypothetical protein